MERVKQFHKAFGCPVNVEPVLLKTDLVCDDLLAVSNRLLELAGHLKGLANTLNPSEKGLVVLRAQLMVEELGELIGEMGTANSLPRLLGELTDLDYVIKGTYLAYGLADFKETASDEIHKANMSKLDDDGDPIIDKSGRVVKSSNFRPANLERLFNG